MTKNPRLTIIIVKAQINPIRLIVFKIVDIFVILIQENYD